MQRIVVERMIRTITLAIGIIRDRGIFPLERPVCMASPAARMKMDISLVCRK
jgi:hypothetical protein